MTSAAAAAPAYPRLAVLVGLLHAGHTCSAMALFSLPTVAPVVAREFGIPAGLIGYQIGVASLGMLATLMLLNNVSRRLGACRTNQIGHLFVASSLLLMMLPSLAFLVLGSISLGIGYGLLTPSASYLMMRFTPAERRNFVFSLQQTSVPLGGILAASTAPGIALAFGWRTSLAIIAVLLLVVITLLQARRRAWDDDRDRTTHVLSPNPFAGIVTLWRDARLRNLSIAGGCYCWWQFCVASFTVVACVEGFGMSLVAAGFVLTAVQVTGVLTRIVCGWIADRIGTPRMLQGLALAWFAGCLASIPLSPAWPVIAVYALFVLHGATSNGWPGPLLAEVGRHSPREQVSSTVAASLVYTNFGKLFGPMVFSNIVVLTGSYGIAFASVGVPALGALWCLSSVRRIAAPRTV